MDGEDRRRRENDVVFSMTPSIFFVVFDVLSVFAVVRNYFWRRNVWKAKCLGSETSGPGAKRQKRRTWASTLALMRSLFVNV